MTLGQFLLNQLQTFGANHIFGIPGDYTLNFIHEIEDHKDIKYVGVSREDSAGYAADAYARMKGCGVCCVTYSVGAMNVMNSIAGAYAERSPVVIIAGKPAKEDLNINPHKHHTIHDDNTQREIFEKITCNVVTLDAIDMTTNMVRIYQALLEMRKESRPIYIEFSNKDIIRQIPNTTLNNFNEYIHESNKLDYYVGDVNYPLALMDDLVTNAKNRVLIIGHEIFRNSLEEYIDLFSSMHNIPVFTTILGKSTLNEHNTHVMGCISQLCTNDNIMNTIKSSDCIITMGLTNTDVDAFAFEPHISINMSEGVKINGEIVNMPPFKKMVSAFCGFFNNLSNQPNHILQEWFSLVYKNSTGECNRIVDDIPNKLTLEYVFNVIGKKLTNDHIVISDIGESLFGMVNIPVKQGQFLSMAYYTSMGFSIPGALGIKYAKPEKRPIIIVGDGAFQMCATEVSSLIRDNVTPIIIVLNNKGYSTERAIMDGKFNDIYNWDYHKITSLMGGSYGYSISDPEKFKVTLEWVIKNKDFNILNVHLDPNDMTPVMKSIAEKMCKDKL